MTRRRSSPPRNRGPADFRRRDRSAPERSEKNVPRPAVRAEQAAPRGRRAEFSADQLLMGRNSLRELLTFSPERIVKVFTVEARAAHGHPDRDSLLTQLKTLEIPVEFVRADELAELAGSDSHQSFVAVLRPRPALELKELLRSLSDQQQCTLLFIDGINDPQNFGTLLRAAECFGVDGVVYSKNRGAGLTPVARKASVGASEIVPLVEVSNLAEAVRKCKESEFWVVATGMGETAKEVAQFEFPRRTVLVIGSEGEGVQPLLLKIADFTVKIPLRGRIDSLNVSQAAAVMLYARTLNVPV